MISDLLASERCHVVAPAGHGKTRMIADAVATMSSGRALILTHTHAGVGAIRRRLAQQQTDPSLVHIETIHGFARRLASAYRQTSGLPDAPMREWQAVDIPAQRVVETPWGQQVIHVSYECLYVDEYQDCTEEQHAFIKAMAQILPTRIFGDPMQAIFGFRNQTLVDWDTLHLDFPLLTELDTPHRWNGVNHALGEWLSDARSRLEHGQPPDFRAGQRARALQFATVSIPQRLDRCGRLQMETSAVVICDMRNSARDLAKRLKGRFTAIEEMEAADLLDCAKRLDDANTPVGRVLEILELAGKCMTNLAPIKNATSALRAGRSVASRGGANAEAVSTIAAASTSIHWKSLADVLTALSRMSNVSVYRKELFEEMRSTLIAADNHVGTDLAEIAWMVRDKTRRSGRVNFERVVSHPLLIKGLEFEHGVIADINRWKPSNAAEARNMYVALTRASTSLTVLSMR